CELSWRQASRSPSAANSDCRCVRASLLPNARNHGQALLFGLCRAAWGEQHLTQLVERALPARLAETGRGAPPGAVVALVRQKQRAAGRQFATTRQLQPCRSGQGVQPSVSTTTTSGRGRLASAASSPNMPVHATAADELDQSPWSP